jgi:hypothetical protein
LWLAWKSVAPSAIAGFDVKMPQTTSLSSVAAEVPKRAGTRVKASRSSLIKTWRVMPITLPKVSMR